MLQRVRPYDDDDTVARWLSSETVVDGVEAHVVLTLGVGDELFDVAP